MIAVLASLFFTIGPAIRMVSEGRMHEAFLWTIWGLFWTSIWVSVAAKSYAKASVRKEIVGAIRGERVVGCPRCGAAQNISTSASAYICYQCGQHNIPTGRPA